MRLEQLEYLVEIAKNHSMSIAAQNLHIAQPSLSFAIKQLEKELNTVIFTRSRKGTFLTKEGEQIYQKALRILADIQSLYQPQTPEEVIKGDLSILTAASFTNDIEAISAKMLEKYPLIKQSFNVLDASKINLSLNEQNEYAFILTSVKTDNLALEHQWHERYHIYTIAKGNIKLLAGKTSPYAKQKPSLFLHYKNCR